MADVYGIDDGDNSYVAAKSAVRRSLNRLTKDGVLTYEQGTRGGSGGGGRAARWRITG